MEKLKAELERLAAVVYDKRQQYQYRCALNTFGLTREEKVRQYAPAVVMARAEMWKAEADLQNATLRAVFEAPLPSPRSPHEA